MVAGVTWALGRGVQRRQAAVARVTGRRRRSALNTALSNRAGGVVMAAPRARARAAPGVAVAAGGRR
jgi:hypothetical protein